MTSLALSFNDVQFDIVDTLGQVWLKATQIGVALGYADDKAVQRLYARNSDEFNESMTGVVKLTTPSGEQETRVFSLRGCHLLAMFARTAIAKQFRKWVLDILDKEVTNQAINPRTTITPEQKAVLHAIVDRRVNGFNSLRAGLWKRHNKHFGVNCYHELLASRFDDAVAYLEAVELRYPTPKNKLHDGYHFFVVKDGQSVYEKVINADASGLTADVLGSQPILLEHIRQVVGEFVGKGALPAPKPLLDINYPAITARPPKSFNANQHWFKADDFVDGNFDPVRDFLIGLETAGYEVTGLQIINQAKTWVIQQQAKAIKHIDKGYKYIADGLKLNSDYGMNVSGFIAGKVGM